MVNPIWEEKLSFLVQQDHEMRNLLLEKGVLSDAYHPEMEKIHIKNSKKLRELINANGFPVLSNAGESGVRYSWLIILHSISSPDFMKNCLIEMRLAAAQKDYPLDLLAYVEDLVLYLEGRLQLYGTQFNWVEDELKPVPIEDIAHLDLRRKSMGLSPFKEKAPSSLDRPPKDPVKKDSDFNEWLRKVGWR